MDPADSGQKPIRVNLIALFMGDLSMQEEIALDAFRTMILIRAFEQRVAELFKEGFVPGFVHLSPGQEAVAVGICRDLRKNDYIISTHRGHHHCIAKGASVKGMMAELFGKKTGLCKGRGGSMHLADASCGILGTNGIVGDGVSISVGAALSAKLQENGRVVVCFFGNGALTTGCFHEGINLAAIHKLPVVYICENNFYAVSMKFAESMVNSDRMAQIVGEHYGLPGSSVDGNDVEAVYEAGKEAVKRARAGEGPSFIECRTFRQRGHFEGDPDSYRTEEERKKIAESDPIIRYRQKLTDQGILDPEKDRRMNEDVHLQIEEAILFAKESPWPDVSDVMIQY